MIEIKPDKADKKYTRVDALSEKYSITMQDILDEELNVERAVFMALKDISVTLAMIEENLRRG